LRLDIQVTRPTVADGRQYTVFVDGEDVTWDLRSAAVDANVSAVSAHPGVRQAANALLRRLLSPEGTVMVGRDIGTVVLPDADLKLFLVASPEARAQRRCQELAARGLDVDYPTILKEIYRRDAYDGGRAAAPMRPAGDAVILDTSQLSVAEEVASALQHLQAARPAGGPARDQDTKRDETSDER
jgi:cytidylate kinase